MANTAEIITDITTKVERIKELREELASLVVEVRKGQEALESEGIILNFPVVDNTTSSLQPTRQSYSDHRVIAEAPVPALSEDEIRAGSEENSDPIPPPESAPVQPDRRSSEQIRSDALDRPTEQSMAQFQQSIEAGFARVVEQGMNDAGEKVAKDSQAGGMNIAGLDISHLMGR